MPLVDWGVRFEDAIRLPVRLQVDLRTVDRGAVAKVANGGSLDLQDVRDEARDALTSYLINLVLITIACAAAMGLLVAFAVRHRHSPRLRYTVGAVVAHDSGARRRADLPAAAKRPDRRAAVLRLRPRHPARAGGGRTGAAVHPPARPGARRAARRPGTAGDQTDRENPAHRPPDDHDRLRPAQQLLRAPRARPGRQRRPAVLRRRPDRSRLAAGVTPGQPRRRARAPVRVRVRQPRQRQPRARPRQPGRDRPDRAGQAQPRRHARRRDPGHQGPQGRRLQRPVRAPPGRELQGPLRARADARA